MLHFRVFLKSHKKKKKLKKANNSTELKTKNCRSVTVIPFYLHMSWKMILERWRPSVTLRVLKARFPVRFLTYHFFNDASPPGAKRQRAWHEIPLQFWDERSARGRTVRVEIPVRDLSGNRGDIDRNPSKIDKSRRRQRRVSAARRLSGTVSVT